MRLDRDTVLRTYGLDGDFPEQWDEPEGHNQDMLEPINKSETDQPNTTLLEQVMASLSVPSQTVGDEPDPLGSSDSVLSVLKAKGIKTTGTESSKYLLSSTNFQPRLFLRNVHASASYDELKAGLRKLQMSMEANDVGLRNAVDDDYEHFVNSKRRLDDVMERLRDIGFSQNNDWGLSDIKKTVDDANTCLTMCTRPLDVFGAQKTRYTGAVKSLEKHKDVFALPSTLKSSLTAKDHDQFVRDLKRGREQLAELVQSKDANARELGQYVNDLSEKMVRKYRAQLWQKLMDTDADGAYAPLFTKLLDLGISENPAFEWMEHKIETFRNRIRELFATLKEQLERSAVEAASSERKLDLSPYLTSLATAIRPSDSASNPDTIITTLEAAGKPIDSVDVLTQWEQLLGIVQQLHTIMSQASIFWREKSTYKPKPGSGLQFTPREDSKITAQCSEMLEELSELLMATFAPSDASEVSSPSFLPFNATSLSVAKYLGEIMDVLSESMNDVSELLTARNPLVGSISAIQQQFVRSLCDSWTRDSALFGRVQDWSSSDAKSVSNLPRVFEMYHLLMLGQVRYILDANTGVPPAQTLFKRVSGAFAAALSQSLKSIHESLVESERGVSRSQLRPKAMGQDSKLLVTLDNLQRIGERSLPLLYERHDALMHLKDSQQIGETINPTLERLSTTLFDLYCRKKRSRLSQIVQQEISRLAPAWATSEDTPVSISNYVYESLLLLVEILALFLDLCSSMASKALLALHEHLLSSILDSLREIESLGRLGTLQTIADLEFIRSVMAKLATPKAKELCQLIFNIIKRASTARDLWEREPREFVRSVIAEALGKDHFAFLSFQTL